MKNYSFEDILRSLNKLGIKGRLNFKSKYNWLTISKKYLRVFKKNEKKKNVY